MSDAASAVIPMLGVAPDSLPAPDQLSTHLAAWAKKLRPKLPQELPPCHLGLLTGKFSDNQFSGTITSPRCALSTDDPLLLAASETYDATFVSLSCSTQHFAPDTAAKLTLALTQNEGAAQAVVFALTATAQVTAVRPVISLSPYELLALMWASNQSFLEQHKAKDLLAHPKLSAPLGNFFSQQVHAFNDAHAALGLEFSELLAFSAIYINAKPSLIMHSPWRQVLSASMRLGDNASQQVALAPLLTQGYEFLKHNLEQTLSSLQEQAGLSTMELALLTTLKHELSHRPWPQCFGAHPELIAIFIGFLANGKLKHLDKVTAPADDYALRICGEELLTQYLLTLCQPDSILERLKSLQLLCQLICRPHYGTRLSIITTTICACALLQPSTEHDFATFCALSAAEFKGQPERSHHYLHVIMATLCPYLELSSERIALALQHELPEFICCSQDLNDLERKLAALNDAISAATLINGYLKHMPERLSTLLLNQPQLLSAGLTKLTLAQQEELITTLCQLLLTEPKQQQKAQLEALVALFPSALLTHLGTQLLLAEDKQSLAAELLVQLASPISNDDNLAPDDRQRILNSLTVLSARYLLHPEKTQLWHITTSVQPLLLTLAQDNYAQQLNEALTSQADDSLISYLTSAKDQELRAFFLSLASGLSLIDAPHPRLSATALESWLNLARAVGVTKVASALASNASGLAKLCSHAQSKAQYLTCLELMPAAEVAQLNLVQTTALFAVLQDVPHPKLQALQPKLLSLLQGLLRSSLFHCSQQELTLVVQLLKLNLSLDPALYAQLLRPSTADLDATSAETLGLTITNLMLLGRKERTISAAVLTQLMALPNCELRVLHQLQELPTISNQPNILGTSFEALIGEKLSQQAPDALASLQLLSPARRSLCLLPHKKMLAELLATPVALNSTELTVRADLLAQLVTTHSTDPEVANWLKLWQSNEQSRAALAQALSALLSQGSELIALNPERKESLELLALLPRKLRLKHAPLFTASPLFLELCQRELTPLLAPCQLLKLNYLKDALALLGLELKDESQAALALCLALCDQDLRAERPHLTTTLLANAPNELLTAVTQLSEPDFAPLLASLAPRLYQPLPLEAFWVNDLALSLMHQVGSTRTHLPETLSHYVAIGPEPLTSKLAAIVPLQPLSQLKTTVSAHNFGPDNLRAIVLSRLGQAPALRPEDFSATAPQQRKYLVHCALELIAQQAPALYELLSLSLKGAPDLVALTALPPLIKQVLSQEHPLLPLSDSDVVASLVVKRDDLAAANYLVAAYGTLADLAATSVDLSTYSLLMMGQSPEVVAQSKEPQALACHIHPLSYIKQGREDLALALEQYSEPLNVLSSATSEALLKLHQRQAEGKQQVILTRAVDGSINLYTLRSSSLQDKLSAFSSKATLSLDSKLWGLDLKKEPLTLYFASTNQPPQQELALESAYFDQAFDAATRDLEQQSFDPGLLAARCPYNSRIRASYFALQVELLAQIAQNSERPLCYLIEYERDIAPLKSYLAAKWPDIAARVQLLSLSALLPNLFGSDLGAGAFDAQATFSTLPAGTLMVIDSLKLSSSQELIEISAGRSITPSLMERGLAVLAIKSEHSFTLKARYSDQELCLILLAGLMTELMLIMGPRFAKFSYYLLEPGLNDGLSKDERYAIADNFILEPIYLKSFASRQAKQKRQNEAQPFFSVSALSTKDALATLEALTPPKLNGTKAVTVDKTKADASATTTADTPGKNPIVAPALGLMPSREQGAKVLARLESEDEDGNLERYKAMRAISHMFIGGHEWHDYQKNILPEILKHKQDALISLPTGGGKSVLFQGPAWYRSFYSGRLSVVITPLRALMVDQVLDLHAKNYLSVDYLSSDRPSYELRQVIERIRSGITTLLYITPERLRSRFFVQLLTQRFEQDGMQGEFFVFDEAHCISQWGKEFRPDYIYAAKLIAKLRAAYDFSVVMCSATMTTQVITDLEQYLQPDHLLLGEVGTNYNPIRPHITLKTMQVPSGIYERTAALIDFIRKERIDFNQSRVLIFCQLRRTTEDLYQALESYALHLRAMQRYQKSHPGFVFAPKPLVEVLYRIGNAPLQSVTADAENIKDTAPAANESEFEQELTKILIAMDQAEEDAAYMAPEDSAEAPELEHYEANLARPGMTFDLQGITLHELCCDQAIIAEDDPILQLAAHIGFFHAKMSARSREHVFTRYKESSPKEVAAQENKGNELWFNDNVALSAKSNSPLEKRLLASNEPLFILCATKAFGMGMDIPNIHYVLHAEPSPIFEDYLQEVGRIGRDQDCYEETFPLDKVSGLRPKLPAICFHDQEDFDKAIERLNKSLISWEMVMSADELVRAYVAHFCNLPQAVEHPVVIPDDIFARSVAMVLDPSDPEHIGNKDLAHNSTLLFYHLEDLGRLNLGFKAPCPLRLTIQRNKFLALRHKSKLGAGVISFAFNEELNAAPSERNSPKDELAQHMVLIALYELLQRFDRTYQAVTQESTLLSDEAAAALERKFDDVLKRDADEKSSAKEQEDANSQDEALPAKDLPQQVELLFDLQYFLQQSNHNTPLARRISLPNTINALLELMAAGAITLYLPFSLSFNSSRSHREALNLNQEEVKYYVQRYSNYVPALNTAALPHLNVTLQVTLRILQLSFEHFRAKSKRRQDAGIATNPKQKEPLPDYPGLAFTNQWLENTVRELIAPYAQDFVGGELLANPEVPWLNTLSDTKNKLSYYLEHYLLPDVQKGVSALLMILPKVKLSKRPASLVVKTWSNAFYLLLDLIYEDSWHLLTELNRISGINPDPNPAVTLARLADNTTEPAATYAAYGTAQVASASQSVLNNWAELVFALGLRHESAAALLNNYELGLSRRYVRPWFQELKFELNTYNYVGQLLSFLQAIGLICKSTLVQYGFELTLTKEAANLPLDSARSIESPFFQRRQQFDAIAQFKRARLAVMQVYCQEVPDDKRRLFIEEFFKTQDYDDYIKHIGNFSDANSSILSEITASNLELAEEQLRANPEQWEVYQSPVEQSLNIMAGPGSGKTHLLALRCVRLIYQEHVSPESVLILAYNRAVVVELKTRLDRLFTNLGLRKIGRKLAIFTFHGLAKVCLGNELDDIDPQRWECTLIATLKAQPQLFIKRFASLRYVMIDEFQDITHARLELLHLLTQCYRTPLYLFTIGDINQSIYGFGRVDNMLQDPNLHPNTGGGATLSAREYAACLGPEPYYRDLQRLFAPTTLSLKLNYRSFPKILARAEPFALNPEYTAQSAPILEQYEPRDLGYSALFDVTVAAMQRAAQGLSKLRSWEQDLNNILAFVKKRNEQAERDAKVAAEQLGLQDSEASARYEQVIFAAAALSANIAAAQSATLAVKTQEAELAPGATAPKSAPVSESLKSEAPKAHSADELLLQSKYQRVESIALFFRTNNEVYRALEQVRALPPEIIQEVEVRLQSANSTELWREREFYALAHFIKSMGMEPLNLSPNLMIERASDAKLTLAELNKCKSLKERSTLLRKQAPQDSAATLKLLTQSLMQSYPNWDKVKLDMAYCLALSFSSTIATGQNYSWSDLYDYYTDLLARDDGGQCYKLYESMGRNHLIAKKRVSLTLTTIHKVKGLEYDMVLIPPCQVDLPLMHHSYIRSEPGQLRFERSAYPSFKQAQFAAANLPLSQDEAADLSEERRLYYVAYTRARKFLYVYYGERERALDETRRYLAPESQMLWSENDDSLDNYVISFNASVQQAGINDYIASTVKPHDNVLIVSTGKYCLIQHQAHEQAPWVTIGRLSGKSKINNQMLKSGVRYLSGLFINSIVAWSYEDTVKSDIKHLREALAQQRVQSTMVQLHGLQLDALNLQDEAVRQSLAPELRVQLYAPFWTPAARHQGYCYLVVLAGRGIPN